MATLTGSFTVSSSDGATIDVTPSGNSGFGTGQLLMLWWVNRVSGDTAPDSAEGRMGKGYAISSTKQWARATHWDDGVGSMASRGAWADDITTACFVQVNLAEPSGGLIQASYGFNSWLTDGAFRLDTDVQDASMADNTVYYAVFNGLDNVDLGFVDTTGAITASGLGYAPNLVFLDLVTDAAGMVENGFIISEFICEMMFAAIVDDGSDTRRSIQTGHNGDFEGTADTNTLVSSGDLIKADGVNAGTGSVTWTSFDTGGFTTGKSGTENLNGIWIAINVLNASIDDLDQQTSTGNFDGPNVGFTPDTAIACYQGLATSWSNSTVAGGSFGFSITNVSGTGQPESVTIAMEDGVGTQNTATGQSNALMYGIDENSSTDYEIDWQTTKVSSNTLKLNQIDAAPSAYKGFVVTMATAAASATLDQEGFRWRDDDGSETSASWLAAQDVNITRDPGEITRLRIIVDASGDPPDQAYQLEYRIKNTGSWRTVK